MKMKQFFLPVLALLMLLAGCGGPKADVSIFIMPKAGMLQDIAELLQKNLQAKLGESPTLKVVASPISSIEKMSVEIAAGDHGIVILPKDQWLALALNGGMVPLDELLNPADFPDGVVELPVGDSEGKKEKHLYAVPIAKTKWMSDVGYKGEELYAFIHPRAPHMDKAKQVLKAIVGK